MTSPNSEGLGTGVVFQGVFLSIAISPKSRTVSGGSGSNLIIFSYNSEKCCLIVSILLKPMHARTKSSDIVITFGREDDTLSTERIIGEILWDGDRLVFSGDISVVFIISSDGNSSESSDKDKLSSNSAFRDK